MYNVRVVGTVTAVAAGWGNAGGGLALLLMPLIVGAIEAASGDGVGASTAWRAAFFFPGALQLVCGAAVLVAADDTPGGDVAALRLAGSLPDVSRARSLLLCFLCGRPPRLPTFLAGLLTRLLILTSALSPPQHIRTAWGAGRGRVARGGAQPPHLGAGRHLRPLLRHRADAEQHHRGVPPGHVRGAAAAR